jgi:hypothetical protein
MSAYYEFSYELTEEESLKGIRQSGIYKKSTGKRAIVESIILAVLTIFFLVSYIVSKNTTELVMSIICVVVFLLLNLMPRLSMRKHAAQGEKNLKLRVYPEQVYVYVGKTTFKIPINGETKIVINEKSDIISLLPESRELLVIPKRAIPPAVREDVIDRLKVW